MKRQGFVIAATLIFVFCGGKFSLGDTNRAVSLSARPNIAGAGGSFGPAFSEDGRFVIFASFANNLVTNDNLAPFLDIFVRDLTTSNTTLVTANLTGIGGGNGSSGSPAISS